MIKSLEEISQILAAAWISTSQEDKILTIVKNLSASPKIIEEEEFHEIHPQEDIKSFCNHPFHPLGEAEESLTTFNGEPPLEPEIK
jgi:hypothetical protein